MHKAEIVFEKIALTSGTILKAVQKRIAPQLAKNKRPMYRVQQKMMHQFFDMSENIKPLSKYMKNKKIPPIDAHGSLSKEVSRIQKTFPNIKRLNEQKNLMKADIYEGLPRKKDLNKLERHLRRIAYKRK